MVNTMLPLALAVSSFGLAFWMPKQTVKIRATFTVVLATVVVLGLIALMQPSIAEEPWLPWVWAAIGLVNVLGWIVFLLRSTGSGEGASRGSDLPPGSSRAGRRPSR